MALKYSSIFFVKSNKKSPPFYERRELSWLYADLPPRLAGLGLAKLAGCGARGLFLGGLVLGRLVCAQKILFLGRDAGRNAFAARQRMV